MRLLDILLKRSKKVEQETPKPVKLNTDDISYTTPTISNEFPLTIPRTKETEFDIFVHEDDYRQNEFLNVSSMPFIQEEFMGIKDIWTNHSKKSGEYTLFRKCHVRKTIRQPDLCINFNELKSLLKCDLVGQVVINEDVLVNGFALKTSNTTYFGIINDEKENGVWLTDHVPVKYLRRNGE